MTIIKVQLKNDSGVPTLAGFNSFDSTTDMGTGLLSSDLLDDSGLSTGVSLSEGAAGFTGYVPALVDGTPDPQYPEIWFERNWYGGAGEKLVLGNLPANTPYTIEIPAHNANGRNTVFTTTGGAASATYVTAVDPDPDPYIPTAPVSINGQTDASGNLSISSTSANSSITHLNGFILSYAASATPTISNVDGDNAVNQGQLVNIDTTGFTEVITAGDIGGVAFESIPDNDPTDDVIQVRIPVTLSAGAYDVTISGATQNDTISGVTYNVTHEYFAPQEPVDSNSLSADQSWTPDTYIRIVTPPANGTLDTANPDWLKLDVRDVYTPDSGFAGEDSVTLEALYSDGTTAQWTATIEVPAVVDSVSVPTSATYSVGEALSFTVNFSGSVNVTGTPALNLTIGGSARQANYASGTGTTALVFTYTVQSGDNDPDGIAVGTLSLDGGTITDGAGNDANLTLNSVGDTSGVLVDGVSPVISINPLTTLDTSPVVSGSAGDSVSLTLVVTGVGTYTPTPSGGTWSQQLPTLALGNYTMTLNGEDAAGNTATQAQATLKIVDEIVATQQGLFRPLFRRPAGSVNQSLFR